MDIILSLGFPYLSEFCRANLIGYKDKTSIKLGFKKDDLNIDFLKRYIHEAAGSISEDKGDTLEDL